MRLDDQGGFYLLDTSVLIDFAKRRAPTYQRLLTMIREGATVGICPLNLTEFYAGLAPRERDRWEPLLQTFDYWPVSRMAAVRAGVYRYDYARQGQTLGTVDALIAAVARDRRVTLLTNNLRHFPMDDIRVLSLALETTMG